LLLNDEVFDEGFKGFDILLNKVVQGGLDLFVGSSKSDDQKAQINGKGIHDFCFLFVVDDF
jgi:hypothetical protein